MAPLQIHSFWLIVASPLTMVPSHSMRLFDVAVVAVCLLYTLPLSSKSVSIKNCDHAALPFHAAASAPSCSNIGWLLCWTLLPGLLTMGCLCLLDCCLSCIISLLHTQMIIHMFWINLYPKFNPTCLVSLPIHKPVGFVHKCLWVSWLFDHCTLIKLCLFESTCCFNWGMFYHCSTLKIAIETCSWLAPQD
jgi:hypothetical protein